MTRRSGQASSPCRCSREPTRAAASGDLGRPVDRGRCERRVLAHSHLDPTAEIGDRLLDLLQNLEERDERRQLLSVLGSHTAAASPLADGGGGDAQHGRDRVPAKTAPQRQCVQKLLGALASVTRGGLAQLLYTGFAVQTLVVLRLERKALTGSAEGRGIGEALPHRAPLPPAGSPRAARELLEPLRYADRRVSVEQEPLIACLYRAHILAVRWPCPAPSVCKRTLPSRRGRRGSIQGSSALLMLSRAENLPKTS